MLTKIVVVVDENHKELFEGDIAAQVFPNLNGISSSDEVILTIEEAFINDQKQLDTREIASFKHWTYWRYTT